MARTTPDNYHLLYTAYIDVPNYGGYEIVVFYIGGSAHYWYCMGSGAGELAFNGQVAEPPSARSSSAGAFRVYYPLYLGSTCTTRTWMVYVNTPPAVTSVIAVVNGQTVKVPPKMG
jgi:hypothetical protein